MLNGRFPIGEELSSKLSCIRFIIGLLERQDGDVCSSQESSPSDEEDRCEQTHKRLLGPDCLKFFDKITRIYPFSNVEKSHMKSSLKLQVNLYLSAVNLAMCVLMIFFNIFNNIIIRRRRSEYIPLINRE